MIATCGVCGNTFYAEAFGRQGCPACQGEVWVGAPANAAVVAPVDAQFLVDAVAIEPEPPPWERRATLGRLRALLTTIRLALLDPRRLFTDLGRTGPAGALTYYLLAVAVPEWIGTSLELPFGTPLDWIGSMRELFTTMQASPEVLAHLDRVRVLEDLAHHPGRLTVVFAVFIPLQAVVRLYSSAWSTHWVLSLTGPLPGGFRTTLKAFAYAETPRVFSALPFVGVPISFVWSWALDAYAVAKAHRITGLRAVIAVVVAPVASALALMVLVALMAWWLTTLFLPGNTLN